MIKLLLPFYISQYMYLSTHHFVVCRYTFKSMKTCPHQKAIIDNKNLQLFCIDIALLHKYIKVYINNSQHWFRNELLHSSVLH